MAGRDHHIHTHCPCFTSSSSVHQTISEMDWERGIWYAALAGDRDSVNKIIMKSENTSNTVRMPDNAGYTALHYSARNGHIDICQILLENGACVDAQTKSGEATPLHKAATTGQLEVMELLLKYGACIDKKDIDGQTVLHRAFEQKHDHLIKYLIGSYPQLQDITDNKGRVAKNCLSTNK